MDNPARHHRNFDCRISGGMVRTAQGLRLRIIDMRFAALERFVNLASRGGGSTAVIMLDLDNFKQLNDEHGHAKGDAVLRDVAAQLIGGLRPTDVVCRYGGEELVVLLPECSLDEAAKKAEQLRERIEALSSTHQANITASLGVASVPETATSIVDVVPSADAALYAAKHAGKNCVMVAAKRVPSRSHLVSV